MFDVCCLLVDVRCVLLLVAACLLLLFCVRVVVALFIDACRFLFECCLLFAVNRSSSVVVRCSVFVVYRWLSPVGC